VAQALDGGVDDIRQQLETRSKQLLNAIQVDRDFVLMDAYPVEVEKALKDAGVPIKVNFPTMNSLHLS